MPTIRRLALLLPTTLALVAGTAPPAHAVTNAALASQVAAVLRDSRVTASTNGTLVADAATGSELAGRNAWPEFHTVSAHRGFWRGSLRRRR